MMSTLKHSRIATGPLFTANVHVSSIRWREVIVSSAQLTVTGVGASLGFGLHGE